YIAPRHLHSFPTRRSSDLNGMNPRAGWLTRPIRLIRIPESARTAVAGRRRNSPPRRPTRVCETANSGIDANQSGFAPENLTTLRSEEHTSELQSLAYLVCR